MEGVLLKWTNYVSGWQQRYFKLDEGVFSYYRNKDEMNSGCKGSVKLSVCDVIVYTNDCRRFDLILGEQRYYLRALSKSDRQRWVVALGNCKLRHIYNESNNAILNNPNESKDHTVLDLRSELRLYHNLMIQQVKELQTNLKENQIPDMTRIDEWTGVLNASCATFLLALDELMVLTHANVPWMNKTNALTAVNDSLSSLSPPIKSTTSLFVNTQLTNQCASIDIESTPPIEPLSSIRSQSLMRKRQLSASSRKYQTFFSTMEFSFENIKPNMQSANSHNAVDYLSAFEFARACRWLFSLIDRWTASDMPNVRMAIGQLRGHLLNAIRRIESATLSNEQIFDDIGSSNGHESANDDASLRQQWFKQVQCSIGRLIRTDVRNKMTGDNQSTFAAVLTLCRTLNFVREFIHQFFKVTDLSKISSSNTITTENGTTTVTNNASLIDISLDSMTNVANEAYSRCLRPYHPWSVRGMAMLIIQHLPARYQLLDILLADNTQSSDSSISPTPPINLSTPPICDHEAYRQLRIDALRYSDALGRFLTLIEGFLACLDLQRIFTGAESY